MRPVFVFDITDFRPLVSAQPQEFLRWITRAYRDDTCGATETTAAGAMQAGTIDQHDTIELLGAWYAVGVTGHDQFRTFTLYECHGGWDGAWRRMVHLYEGVPDSLFLSAIDGLRFGATTVPLVGAPGCPTATEIAAQGLQGPSPLSSSQRYERTRHWTTLQLCVR